MREYRFRGKRIENGEWVYGSLISDRYIVGNVLEWNDEYFNTEWWAAVDPSTVGQYTGIKDKNGKEIYEGDILSNGSHVDWIVVYEEAAFKVKFPDPIKTDRYYLNRGMAEIREIIGNIYENPEILDGCTQ